MTLDPQSRPRRSVTARRGRMDPVPHRPVIAGTLLGLVVLVGVLAEVLGTPSALPAPDADATAAVTPTSSIQSTAFCTQNGGADLGAVDVVVNTSDERRLGEVATISSADKVPVVQPLSVPPRGTLLVHPAFGLKTGSLGSTFTFSGGGVSVAQAVSSPAGWSMAACSNQVNSAWNFAGGSTTSGQTLAVTLYNPTTSEAVVNLSFQTASGPLTPLPYQGLVLAPGAVISEPVGAYVQGASGVGTRVSAQSGSVVASELATWSAGGHSGLGLLGGAPAGSRHWWFTQNTATTGGSLAFTVANPGPQTVSVTLRASLSDATVPSQHLRVPANSTAVVVGSRTTGWPLGVPYAVSVTSTGPVVVGREVGAAAKAASPVWGSVSGTPLASPRWLVAGPTGAGKPVVPGAAVASLAVLNTGSELASVVVRAGGNRQILASFTLGPDAMVVLPTSTLRSGSSFVVTASQPVTVEADATPGGAPGVVVTPAAPLPSSS